MPLRRPPNDPSPRLRAVLEAARRQGGSGGDPGRGDPHRLDARRQDGGWQDGGRQDPGWSATDGRPALSATAVEPWLPDDTWVPPRAAEEGPGTQDGRSTGRHRRQVADDRGSGDPPRVLALPSALRGARLSAPRLATVGLVLVAVLAGGVFAARVVWARVASSPQSLGAAQSGSAGSAAPAGSAVTPGPGRGGFGSATAARSTARSPSMAGAAGATTGASVTVHVVGRVARPGVVVLPSGSRVTDAVTRAGGALRDADLSAINLARVVVDGEQLRVPRPGEQVIPAPGAGAAAADAGGAGNSTAAGGASAPSPVVNLNTGSAAELDALPGVGPVLARRIVDWRAAHGRFVSVDQLGEVSGIGEKLLGQLRTRVAV